MCKYVLLFAHVGVCILWGTCAHTVPEEVSIQNLYRVCKHDLDI